MNRNELISRRDDLEQMMSQIASELSAADVTYKNDHLEILIDSYQATKNRLAVINAKLGEQKAA